MKSHIVPPSPFPPELADCVFACNEKDCAETATHHTFILALDGGMSFDIMLCAKHAELAKRRQCPLCGQIEVLT